MAVSSGFSEHFPSFSLFTKGDDSGKMVPAWGCFKRTCFWSFRSIATSNFDWVFPGNKHFIGSGYWPNCVSQCCVHRISLKVPKHLDSCSNFCKAGVIQGLISHTLFLGSKGWILPRPYTACGIGSPLKRLLFAGGVFLDAILYYQ